MGITDTKVSERAVEAAPDTRNSPVAYDGDDGEAGCFFAAH